MTDIEKEKQKKRITSLADKWLGILGLYHWKISFIFEIDKEEPETRYSPGRLKAVKGLWEHVMDTEVDPYYLQANISIWLPVIKELTEEELEESFLHELCHVIVSPMSKPSKCKEEELVATSLARAIQNTYNTNHGSRNINP